MARESSGVNVTLVSTHSGGGGGGGAGGGAGGGGDGGGGGLGGGGLGDGGGGGQSPRSMQLAGGAGGGDGTGGGGNGGGGEGGGGEAKTMACTLPYDWSVVEASNTELVDADSVLMNVSLLAAALSGNRTVNDTITLPAEMAVI